LSLIPGTTREKVCYLLLEKRVLQQLTLHYPTPQRNLKPAAYELQRFTQTFEEMRLLAHGVPHILSHLPYVLVISHYLLLAVLFVSCFFHCLMVFQTFWQVFFGDIVASFLFSSIN